MQFVNEWMWVHVPLCVCVWGWVRPHEHDPACFNFLINRHIHVAGDGTFLPSALSFSHRVGIFRLLRCCCFSWSLAPASFAISWCLLWNTTLLYYNIIFAYAFTMFIFVKWVKWRANKTWPGKAYRHSKFSFDMCDEDVQANRERTGVLSTMWRKERKSKKKTTRGGVVLSEQGRV